MKCLRLLFATVTLGATGPTWIHAQAPASFDLALTINDGTTDSVYRGWPLVVRGDAVLMDGAAAPVALNLSSLALVIAPAQGPAVRWPLRRVTEFASAPTLGPSSEAVRVVWLLPASETVAIAPGMYTARWSWAGKTAPALAFTVSDPPATLPDGDVIRRVLLQSEAAQLLGDTAGALAALEAAQTRHPDAIDLLVQRARVHLQRGEHTEALKASQQALKIFHRDDLKSSHPPVSILAVEAAARAELFKAPASAVPLPALPSRGTRTGSAPAGPRAANPSAAALAAGVTPAGAPRVGPQPSSAQPSPSGVTVPVLPRVSDDPLPGRVVPAAELTDLQIRADAAGQWAATASAGSQYGKSQYAAAKATGAPDVPVVGNSPDAWCPASRDKGADWLEVTFAKPVRATEVRVRQNDAAGAIVKVEAIEPDGTVHGWWAGVDPYKAPTIRDVAWFAVRVPKTSYLVARIKLTLNLASGPGWKQIDAVQLVAADGS